MKITRRASRRATLTSASIGALALLVGTAGSAQAATAPGLGTADSFAILAGTGVMNTGTTTVVTGDLGTDPTPTITGAGPGADSITLLDGATHAADAVSLQAKNDLVTAYNNAANQDTAFDISGDLAGSTLAPGVYTSDTSIGLSGALTLDGENVTDAVWIFQAASTLDIFTGASFELIRGAQACNVFWQVGSSATLYTDVDFIGTIMALTTITLQTNATVNGRVLARNGAVNLDANTITRPVCAAAPDDTDGTDGASDTGGTDGASDTGGTDGTGGQVTDVPSGSVATGDGSTSPRPFDAVLAASVVAIGAGAVVVAVRRRNGWVA